MITDRLQITEFVVGVHYGSGHASGRCTIQLTESFLNSTKQKLLDEVHKDSTFNADSLNLTLCSVSNLVISKASHDLHAKAAADICVAQGVYTNKEVMIALPDIEFACMDGGVVI